MNEAMAADLSLICLGLGGPGQQVAEETGVKVRAGILEQIINDLSRAMRRLTADLGLRIRTGDAARHRVREIARGYG